MRFKPNTSGTRNPNLKKELVEALEAALRVLEQDNPFFCDPLESTHEMLMHVAAFKVRSAFKRAQEAQVA